MAQHEYIERPGSGSGMGSGAIVGIIAVVALAAVVTLFLLMGGANRFTQAPAAAGSPNTTNVTVPAPAQAQPAAPQINVPSSIDVNVKQPAPAAS
ncbi:MAG TPA: hypothetical protein VGK54_18260 [Chloroflexota bacterium]